MHASICSSTLKLSLLMFSRLALKKIAGIGGACFHTWDKKVAGIGAACLPTVFPIGWKSWSKWSDATLLPLFFPKTDAFCQHLIADNGSWQWQWLTLSIPKQMN